MRILYIGSGDIGLPALEWLAAGSGHEVVGVVTQPDKPAGRRMELLAVPVKQFALRRGLSVFQPVKIRAEDAVAMIQEIAADVIVVMAYGQILPRAVLDAARVACLNLHASLLPRHRGAAPVQAAIEAGDRETGITVMLMDEGLDTGDILLAKRIAIRRRETGGSLHDRLAALAPGALRDALELLAAGKAPREKQDAELATYAPKLDRGDGRVDWNAPAIAVGRRIRAMNPWPAAWTLLQADGREAKLKIFSAVICCKTNGAAGTVLRADARGILVGAGEGSVLLREIQLEGKRRMGAGDFLRGHVLAAGTALGMTNEPMTND
jgi:methionyl-tRNA formyltransferase